MDISAALVGRYSTGSIGLLLGRDVGLYLGRYSTDIQLIVSVDTRYSILDTRPTLSVDTIGRQSTDISADIRPTFWPTFGQDIDRHLVERRSTCSSSWYTVSGHYTTTLHYATTLGRHSTDSVGRYSIDTRRHSTDTRPTLGRHSTDSVGLSARSDLKLP